jgi:anti-anti-sigma factor
VNTTHDREPAVLAGTTVVIACGASDVDLTRQLAESLRLGARQVVVDLGDAEMLDSSTLDTLRRLAGKLRSNGGRLSVVCRHPGLAGVLDLTLLSQSFSVFRSLDSALRAS